MKKNKLKKAPSKEKKSKKKAKAVKAPKKKAARPVPQKASKKAKAAAPAKKLTAQQKKAELFLQKSEELTIKGKKRGFITYDEILKTFPDIENNVMFLDELYEKLAVAGVDVLEGGNLLD